MVTRSFALLVLLAAVTSATAQTRTVINFNGGWKFNAGDDSLASHVNYDDSKWRNLSVPHDWSIESDFIKDAPATPEGGSLPGGIGWYRKSFALPAAAKDKMVTIEFDGVHQNSEVWINGHYMGKRPNGYINFSYELTPHLNPGKNVIAVKVDNSQQPNSRWYTGSGIYRDIKLVLKNPQLYMSGEGPFITSSVSSRKASLNFLIELNELPASPESVSAYTSIYDAAGRLMVVVNKDGKDKEGLGPGMSSFEYTADISNPVLWSVDRPYLYKAVTKLFAGGKQVDEVTQSFGIRYFRFDEKQGFFLNGKSLKIYGVCMHHDLGALGAAFNKAAARRQLRILKEMGCNAIRFAHNPPATAMLDLCDAMGFLVIDEAFDMWKKKKNKYDYHKDFTEWHKKDLEDQVRRDRNHPSVIMWSIGNEIREQFDSTGITLTRELADIVRKIDPTRPVTSGMTETKPQWNFIAKSGALDVFGFNYRDYDYDSLPLQFPGQKFIASESASSIATRGVYYFPSDSIRTWPIDYKQQPDFDGGNPDFTGPAFDNTKAYWGNTHEKSWLAVKQRSFIAGAFVWSGFDYIGEPLPYPRFPARSSYFGIIDLAGFPKDIFYMYQSEWSPKNVLHLFPHWNWNTGDMVDLWAYYNNADEVELYVNGKSAGKRTMTDSTLHVMWRVPYEAGQIRAVSRKKGVTVVSQTIKTAGPAHHIELVADKKIMKTDGADMLFVTARVVDRFGNLVPDADQRIEFSITGNGQIAGTDNGYQADTSSLKKPVRHAWKGLALVMIQSNGKKGNITLKAFSPGLVQASIKLTSTD